MRRGFMMLVAGVLLALACISALASGDPQLSTKFNAESAKRVEVGGKLLVDLHTAVMLAVGKDQKVKNWFNAGYLWGDFGDFGFAKYQYPTVGMVGGVKAITFNGKNVLVGSPVVPKDKVNDATRGNLATPDSMIGPKAEYTIEVWAYNPTVELQEALVSWANYYLPYPDAKYAPAKKWNHIVVVHSGGQDTLYVNGEQRAKGKFVVTLVGYDVPSPSPIVIGERLDSHGFTGSIAAVRIHEKPITADQVAKNFKGGIALGTTFVPNIDPTVAKDDATWGPCDQPNLKQYFSKHFRMMWDPAKDVNNIMTDETARTMLTNYEYAYDYYEQMAMAAPVVSANKKDRGDGMKYKINICINWGGGAFGGFNGNRGCGYPIHAPGVMHAHELGHAYQSQQMGGLAGNWWETHSQWLSKDFEAMENMTQAAKSTERVATKFNYDNAMITNAMFFVSNGRDYYHCFHIFCQLGLEPELGPLSIAKLWNTNGWDAYPWIRAEEIFPDKVELLKEQWVKMARRNITWDYPDAIKNPKGGIDTRMARTLLEPIPYEPGVYRCPKDMAPQQFGYVTCPLQPTSKTVTVDLGGYIDSERGSDWRACLVAVNTKQESRYGDIFSRGKSTMTLKPDEKELYLVVAATPKTEYIDMAGEGPRADYRCPEQSQFPFTVKVTGCEPKDIWIPAKPTVPGKAHPNGGGFVADTAKVDPTAYVGPNAQVLDHAQVLGNARVEDYAVVKDSGIVRDHAVVSGHGLVSGAGCVKGWAKVRDFGTTTSIVADFAKVTEHGVNGGNMSEYATAKGCSASFGNNYGTSIVDGGYAKSNEVSKGIWLSWSWGQGKNAGELDEDLAGVYAQYLFDKQHPYLAWDTKGVTHGYLVGKPRVANGVLSLNGKDQFVEMPKDSADMHDMSLVIKVNWNGGKGQVLWSAGNDAKNCVYLTPSNADGVMAFGIIKDGKEQVVKAGSALPTGKMVEVKVVLSGDNGTIYVDGQQVGKNDQFTLNPEDLNPKECYLGRGVDGGYFSGQIDDITIYSIALIDTAGPYPNPGAWHVEPTAYSDTGVTMLAQVGCDPKPGVEYFFTETTGKGHSSGWQKSPLYQDKGLQPGETYTYTVKLRDASGNETKPSEPKSAKFESAPYYVADKTPGGAPMFVIEAEHPQKYVKGTHHEWKYEELLSNFRGDGAMYCGPEDGPAIVDYMLDSPRLDYRFKVDQPGKYYLWTRGFGRWWLSNSIYFAVDGKNPQKAYVGWENLTYRWKHINNMDSRQALEPIQIDFPGIHTISVWMCEDGGSLDALLLTTANYDEFQPTDELDINKDLVGKGKMPESRVEKDGKAIDIRIPVTKPEWSSLHPVVLDGNRVVMQAKDYSDRLANVEYIFDRVGTTYDASWQKSPYLEIKNVFPDKEYSFRFKVKSDRGESEWSDTLKAKWDASKAVTEPANGTTVIEAEHFSNKVAAPDGHDWTFAKAGANPDLSISGDGYMQSNIKDGSPFLGKTLDLKARLDYQVNFTKAGPHYIWVRGVGVYRFNHTLFAGLDMASGDWGKIEMGSECMSWMRSGAVNVDKPGVKTINVWLNHDALMVDRIIVTTDANFKPSAEAESSDGSPTGIGPAETKAGK